MALIAIEEWYFYGAMLVAFFALLISVGIYMAVKNNAPDAFVHWKAKRNGDKVCRVHYRGRKCRDYIATVDKAEKEIGTPYWTVEDVGIKFKPEPGDIEFIEDTIPCCNYFENMPEAVKINQAVAFNQLKNHFTKLGMPIEGIEDIAFYVASEAEGKPKDRAINNARIDSIETREHLKKYLDIISKYKTQLTSMKLESGVFSWQTAMNALDSVIAYTSSNLAHTKETIRAAIMRQEENKRKDYIMYAIIAFILALSAATVIVVTRK